MTYHTSSNELGGITGLTILGRGTDSMKRGLTHRISSTPRIKGVNSIVIMVSNFTGIMLANNGTGAAPYMILNNHFAYCPYHFNVSTNRSNFKGIHNYYMRPTTDL